MFDIGVAECCRRVHDRSRRHFNPLHPKQQLCCWDHPPPIFRSVLFYGMPSVNDDERNLIGACVRGHTRSVCNRGKCDTVVVLVIDKDQEICRGIQA